LGPLVHESTHVAALRALAVAANAEASLARILALCSHSTDSRFLFSVVAFVSSRESLTALRDWSSDNIHCLGLNRLGEACWNHPELLAQMRPFGPDQRVDRLFRGQTEEQYLATMAACRRALPSNEVAAWLQVLRVYILVRAMDAAESGAPREAHLLEVCRTLRYVSETTGHERHEWIAKITGSSIGFLEFEAEAAMRCRSALANTKDATAKSFYRALISILDHKPWCALPARSRDDSTGSLAPYTALPDGLDIWRASHRDPTSDSDQVNEPNELDAIGATQETGPAESDSKRRFNGEKLRLETLEKYLFLPHSWHHISVDEEALVFARLTELLTSADKVDQFGACVVFLAVLTGQTINDVSKMRFATEADTSWRLNIPGNSIHKLAPRFSKRWQAPPIQSGHAHWVTPLSELWEYRLSTAITRPLNQAARGMPAADDLDKIWQGLNPGATLVSWFNSVFADTKHLRRLSGPTTAGLLSLRIFKRSHDHATARLLASDHRTALPAACAYGAYRGSEVARLLSECTTTGLAHMVLPPLHDQTNAAGSELDISLPLVRSTIAKLTDRVNAAAQSASWCKHHNLLTALTILALLASTGARPVNSPFQCALWMDFERGLIYVQDKVTGPTQGSRICVLSDFARSLLQDMYFPHMRQLAAALEPLAPAFSAEMVKVLGKDPEARLPLFLFLRKEPSLDWMEVTETQLDAVCGFDWPLPWNLFRHFSSTQLRRLGLHPDIRDALLGHAARDAESHGDFSSRVPLEDFETARPLVNQLQKELGFVLPNMARYTVRLDALVRVGNDLLQGTRPFGRQARELRRQQVHVTARAVAKSEIESFLCARTVDQLSGDELDQLARQMLLRKSGLPHVMGSLRYETLEDFLSTEWRVKGRHAKLKRRYVLIEEGRPCFTEQALTARARLQTFASHFESLVQTRSLTTERPVLAAALAAIEIILHCRLAHFPMLCALLCNTESIRLVRFDGRHWLEWGHGAAWQDGKPVVRIEVSDRAAHWISLATKSRTLTQVAPLPTALAPLCATLEPAQCTLAEMIRQLVTLQSQENSLGLAGFIAAHLAGSRPSSALPHPDWIRIARGAAPIFSDNRAGASELEPDDADVEVDEFFRNHHATASRLDEPAMERCRTLFDKVRERLDSDADNTNISAQIARDVKASGFARGDAPYLLCHFIVHVLRRKPMHGTRDRLRSSTALRYWHSLAHPFLSVAADDNWIDVEEDELTESYEQIVATMTADLGATREPTESNAAESSTEGNLAGAVRPMQTDSSQRTLMQLREFHDFARSTYGLPDPDWSELSTDLVVGVGRPGVVTVDEYLAVLSLQLAASPVSALDELTLSRSFVLLACARFGLRLGEAVGLQRSEWLDIGKTVTVVVASNPIRGLKTPHSRRLVPLVETLTSIEREVLDAVLNQWTHREGVREGTPLLAEISKGSFKARKSAIGSHLLGDIKRVTQHSGSTLHALRHGFGMRMLSLLQELPLGSTMPAGRAEAQQARRLLTGSPHIDRRAIWAVARLLGHAGPGITVRSYINCIHLWLPPIVNKPLPNGILRPVNLVDLDGIAVDPDYLSRNTSSPDDRRDDLESPIVRAMRFLRLLAIGQTEISAQSRARLSSDEVLLLTASLNAGSSKLAPNQSRYESYQILAAIPVPRYRELIQLLQAARPAADLPRTMPDWLDTIGPSRQIALFEEHHFRCMAQFMRSFGLTQRDVLLVSKTFLHPVLQSYAKRWKLDEFIKPREWVAPSFQLDVARYGSPERIATERIVAIITPDGTLKSSYELILLWILWKFWINASQDPTTIDQT